VYRRKDKSGKRTGPWYITVAGVRQSSGTTDKARAKRLEGKLNEEAWDRQHGLTTPKWEDAALAWSNSNLASAKKYHNRKYATFWIKHLDGKKLTEIDGGLIHSIISQHLEVDLENRVPGNATANQYVGFVRMIIRAGSNINPRFTAYPVTKFREVHWTPEQWRLMIPHFTPDELDLFTFALATGLREANVMFFRPQWQDGPVAVIPASSTKTAVPYGIPLNKTAQEVLKRRLGGPIRHLDYVFSDRGKAWYTVKALRALKRVCKATGVPYITFHGIRHTTNTWLAKAGVPKEIRMRLMGHKAMDVHDGYTHLNVEDLRPFAERLDALFLEMRGENPSHQNLSA
jgi:integrase